ncbi:MAG: hypothetical protein A2Y34_14065 [Spirochaetes bacterium GWC1_27_15]|nr:MAG: hypothetical protein A2Y34_14065 [Spirochaetes bacterium GWC1_27_15]
MAVGDAEFQKKCLGKMDDVAKNQGRTVLFVSHNMAAINALCKKGILLRKGGVEFIGDASEAINKYLTIDKVSDLPLADRPDIGPVKIVKIEIKDKNDNIIESAMSGQDIKICLHFQKKADYQISNVNVSVGLRTQLDIPVFNQHNRMTGDNFGELPEKGIFVCKISNLPLPASSYILNFSIMPNNGRTNEYYDFMENAIELNVIEGDFYGSGEIPPISHGICLVDAKWSIEKME